jgi:hypothetical protein
MRASPFRNITKRADRWVFGAEYLEKRYSYKNISIPQSQFTVDAGYYLKFLSDWRKTLFLSLGASAIAGYYRSFFAFSSETCSLMDFAMTGAVFLKRLK